MQPLNKDVLQMNGESLSAWQQLAFAAYQAAGAFDLPVRFLNVLSAAADGQPFSHLLGELQPVSLKESGPAEAWRNQFECRFSHLSLESVTNEGLVAYTDPKTQGAWEGWLAAKNAVSIEDVKDQLRDPRVVYVNMLRRIIAPITMEQCAHIHGQDMVRRWHAFENGERHSASDDSSSLAQGSLAG